MSTADKIIDDVLGFARVQELVLVPSDVNATVDATVERITVPANVKMVRKFGAHLPHVTVDVSQIQRVFANVITNAIDAMDKGGTLTIVTRHQGRNGQQEGLVGASFQDTGIGIPQENLGKIFEPLFTTKSKGTGLGLPTCQNIIHAHRGRIEVASEPGKGTTVTVKLPI